MKDVQIISSQDISSYSKLVYATNRSSDVACIQTSRKLDFKVWHKRIGHVPTNKIKLLPIDVIFPKGIQDFPCDVCPKAKQQRLPFHLTTISANAAFELIHVDTWGPYHTKTYTGHRFFLTIIDDYTRTTWTYLMVTKDEALGLIKSFVKKWFKLSFQAPSRS